MIEDEPRADVAAAPPVIDNVATYTEIVVSELHGAASRSLSGRRRADYLGAELRGPLLASAATIEVREYDHRGQIVERAPVVPRRFEGIRFDVPSQIAVAATHRSRSSSITQGRRRPASS